MSDVLGIYTEELESAVEQMKEAYEIFAAFSKTGFQTEVGYLEGMNADFTEKLARTLEIVREWKLENLRENLDIYIRTAERIYQEIKGIDDEIAGHMEIQGGQ